MPRLDVDKVDLYAIRELASPPGVVTEQWLWAFCDPATGISYKDTIANAAAIISNLIGSGIVIPDRVYRIGVSIPAGASVGTYTDSDGFEKGYIIDPYLDGKVFSLNRRGVELMVKGLEWDNDNPAYQVRLLGSDGVSTGDVFSPGEIVIAQFQPQISPIISTPDAIARFVSGVQLITSDTTLTPSTYRKLIVLTSGFKVTLGADYPENVICAFTTNQVGNTQSTISAPAGQNIAWNGSNVQSVWVGKNERVSFIRNGNTWYVVDDTLGYDRIGQVVPGRLPGANQIIAQGQTILRADYPRVVDFINRLNLAYPGSVVSAAQWAANKDRWGFGDGFTTIQVPDLRGKFPRWLDMGAGVDVDRNTAGTQNIPGSGQADAIKTHTIQIGPAGTKIIMRRPGGPGGGFGVNNVNGWELAADNTATYNGASETRPINTGELPLIYV